MEAILNKLVQPNNELIQQGTAELKEAFKKPSAIPELCSILTSSSSAQIRQYSALLLRKKLGKTKSWRVINQSDRITIKSGLLSALTNEPEKTVQHAIVQLISVIAKHDLPNNGWPELMPFLDNCFQSEAPGSKSIAMFMASALCESSSELMKSVYLAGLCKMFAKSLCNSQDLEPGFYATLAMTRLVPVIGSEEMRLFQPLVGSVTNYIRRLIETGSEERAAEAMEIYDELFESEVAIVLPHIKPIIEMSMVIAGNSNHSNELQIKAISIMGTLTKLKKKTIVKYKLYIPMINVIFPLMCTIRDEKEEDEDDEDDDDDNSSPSLCAAQTLDCLAINLPPEKYMSALMNHLSPALESNNPALLKGAFEAMAVSAEGCSDHIRKKYLVNFLKCIESNIQCQVPVVRNAALYALGQFSDYCQPEINKYANTILPVLVNYLDLAINQMQSQPSKKAPLGLDRVFYALQIYCENLGKKLIPYLPELMNRLLVMASPTNSFPVSVKQLAISGIGSISNAVKGAMAEYFERTVVPLKTYLQPQSSDDGILLLTQSMDTLGSLARGVGPTNFVPSLAEECCKLGIELMQQNDDPDVRKAAFTLFGAVAFVAKGNMESILPGLVEQMLTSATSKEGISLEFKDEDNSLLPLEELSDDEDHNGDEISLSTDDSIHDKIKSINVENSYKEEKETAIAILKDFCVDIGPKVFLQFVPKCLEDIWPLLEYPHEDIRQESVRAVTHFCAAYYIELDQGIGNLEIFNQTVVKLVPTLTKMVLEDESVEVVCACLDMVTELLKSCKQGVTNLPGLCDDIIQCVHNVIQSKCACMDNDLVGDVNADDDDDEEAEQDEVLFEYAGDILPNLGLALNDPSKFKNYFAGMLSHLLKKSKDKCSTAEKSFAAGSLAECMEPLHGTLEPFAGHILPVFTRLAFDEDDDVRNNAIFGMGELVLHAGPPMNPHFGKILETLSKLLVNEKSARVLDQILGAVCRLILSNKALVPLEQVLPVVFQNVPMKEDMDEYETFFNAIQLLYVEGYQSQIVQILPKIVECGLHALNSDDEDMKKDKVFPPIKLFLARLNMDHPDQLKTVLNSFPAELTAVVALA